jgi:hypothetical protein
MALVLALVAPMAWTSVKAPASAMAAPDSTSVDTVLVEDVGETTAATLTLTLDDPLPEQQVLDELPDVFAEGPHTLADGVLVIDSTAGIDGGGLTADEGKASDGYADIYCDTPNVFIDLRGDTLTFRHDLGPGGTATVNISGRLQFRGPLPKT